MRIFTIPSWIPTFNEPELAFDEAPPTYQQITKIIRKMKTSGSPCPLDQIPVIVFKRSAYLRSYLKAIINSIWASGKIPEAWRKQFPF